MRTVRTPHRPRHDTPNRTGKNEKPRTPLSPLPLPLVYVVGRCAQPEAQRHLPPEQPLRWRAAWPADRLAAAPQSDRASTQPAQERHHLTTHRTPPPCCRARRLTFVCKARAAMHPPRSKSLATAAAAGRLRHSAACPRPCSCRPHWSWVGRRAPCSSRQSSTR